MALNPEFVFERKYITEPLKRVLGLPDDVWSVVLNDELDSAYYLTADLAPVTIALKPGIRPLIELAVQRKRQLELSLPTALRRASLSETA
ncbi:hypothetical protein [Asticcacaulis sp. 201]|uniref:hypothetical protein n=1 Tax=Asticcacaulis sp. 201 TaxID=3028787 RepID=UPI0029163762|nr:hypothetical protein [Asticcacaulis sp. 201]MDV6329533.1 hypothetical protein [Asticcacaulis sp. 201]